MLTQTPFAPATILRAAVARAMGPVRASLLLRLVAENAWAHRWAYAVALGLMAVVAAMGGAIALIMEDVMDQVFVAKRPEMVGVIAGSVLAIFLVRGVATYGQTVILARIGNRIVAGLQTRLYDHVLAQGLAFHQDQGAGDMATRISHNANAARAALQLLATRLGTDLLSAVTLIGVMIYQDRTLSAIALIGLPVVLGGVAWLVQRVRNVARAEIALLSTILGAMGETIQGARVIKAFGLEDQMRARMARSVTAMRGRSDRIAMIQGLVNPLMETTAGIAAAAVILYGGAQVIGGGLAVGTFFSFITALFMAADPARRLAQLNVALRVYMTGVEFIYEVLDTPPRLVDAPGAAPLRLAGGEVRITDARFSYGEGAVLAGMNLTARAGEVTALVGPSGGGKSTVLALIERFYDLDSGAITIDGQDIRDVTLASLRQHIALVSQETFLFDATVAENIGFGRPGASRAQIVAAAEAANAAEFIAGLEQGYDSPVGPGGGRLSGGQRQRIAIARAMLRDAPILLLDEATSALDAETEARVQQALERLMVGRTTLVIAHRLATVRRAHQIAVVVGGQVTETGTHDTLVRGGGVYARLAALQFGPAEETR